MTAVLHVEPGHHQASACLPDELAGPRSLWAAVMHSAVTDLVGRDTTIKGRHRDVINTELARGARRWFASDDRDIGSFLWICSVLELDPERVRGRLGAPPE